MVATSLVLFFIQRMVGHVWTLSFISFSTIDYGFVWINYFEMFVFLIKKKKKRHTHTHTHKTFKTTNKRLVKM